ncbi:MAG TPA: hypothetical protein VIH88_04535 [Candidatus Acidoferrales bacterium]
MNNQGSSSKGSGTLAELATQRPERIASQLPIEVCGFDRCGHFFTERSETCNVSVRGCKFYLRTEVEREAIVALRVIERHDQRGNDAVPVLFQVARIEREPGAWALGAWKLRAEDLWPMRTAHALGRAPSLD